MSVLMYLFVGIKFKKYKIPNIPPYPLTEQGIQGDIIRKRKEICYFLLSGRGWFRGMYRAQMIPCSSISDW